VTRRMFLTLAMSAGLVVGHAALGAAAATKPATKPATITVRTATHGAGPHPVLAWKPVHGATRYLVSVNTKPGAPYWSWSGDTTKVRFGGGPLDTPKTAPTGATLTHQMRWFVVALGDDGRVLAASKPRPIAP
jgi:hypothetical protein